MEKKSHTRPTILVVDDNEVIAFAVQRAVPECAVIHAVDGIAGLDILRKSPTTIDLIVLDLVMPRMDGPTTCMLIRKQAEDVPILPFTGLPNDKTLALLPELGCLPTLLKPVDPSVLAQAIRDALGTTPPPLAPGNGVLSWAQEQASRQEYVGRTTPTLQVIVCAATGIIQRGLQDLLEHAGARVAARTPFPKNLPYLLDTSVDVAAVVTTRTEFAQVAPIAQQYRLSLVCVVSTLADGLSVIESAAEVVYPFGIVLEHVDERQTIMHMELVLHQLARGEMALPPTLREPFAALKLSEQDQKLLSSEVRGLASQDIANHLVIDQPTLRQRRKRLREKLSVPEEQSLGVWAEMWWHTHHRLQN